MWYGTRPMTSTFSFGLWNPHNSYSKISLKHSLLRFFGMLGFKSYNCWVGNPTPILWIIVQMAPKPPWLWFGRVFVRELRHISGITSHRHSPCPRFIPAWHSFQQPRPRQFFQTVISKTKYPSSKYLWFRHLAKFTFEPAFVLFAQMTFKRRTNHPNGT